MSRRSMYKLGLGPWRYQHHKKKFLLPDVNEYFTVYSTVCQNHGTHTYSRWMNQRRIVVETQVGEVDICMHRGSRGDNTPLVVPYLYIAGGVSLPQD